jgi:hypothetical protein
MRKAIAIVLGAGMIAAAIYINANSHDAEVFVHLSAHATAAHRPLIIAQATAGGAAWRLSSSDLEVANKETLSDSLQRLEELLIERLIATSDPDERDRLIAILRETHAYSSKFITEAERVVDVDLEPHEQQAGGSGMPASGSLDKPGVQQVNSAARHVNSHKEAEALVSVVNRPPVAPLRERLHIARDRIVDDITNNRTSIVQAILWSTLYFAIIVFGIYTSSMYEALGGLRSQRPLTLRQVLQKAATAGAWQGLLASPIVFALVMLSVPRDEFSLAMAFFAYQNGFFWRATLQRYSEVREIVRRGRSREQKP